MKKAAVALSLGFLLIVGCRKEDIATGSSQTRLLAGEYLSISYINKLHVTRSPLKAGEAGGVDLVVLEETGAAKTVMAIYNFHEGGLTLAVSPTGRISVIEGGTLQEKKPRFAAMDERTFTLGLEGEEPKKYVFVQKAADYVARAVLVGRYKDRRGLDYQFREDGWAVFPDRRFKYEVGLDHVLDNFDYFTAGSGDTQVMAFTVAGDNMEIFATSGEGGIDEIANKHPLYSLHRVPSSDSD